MIYVTGDTHGGCVLRAEKLENETTKEDLFIVAGDFGHYWDNSPREEKVRNIFKKFPFTLAFVDGNHENFDIINKLPVIEWNGGKIHYDYKSQIIHLMRGQVYTIEGKKIFTFGGGYSIDKRFREEGKSYWKEEIPSKEEMQEGLDNLAKVNYEVDYIITHSCPISIFTKIKESNLLPKLDFAFEEVFTVENYLEKILEKTKFKKWYFGHIHLDTNIEDNIIALYRDIKNIVGE